MDQNQKRFKIGIDIGGTFTDLVIMDDHTGTVVPIKVPSTPDRPSRGVVEAVNEAVKLLQISHEDISYFVHGTTTVLNTIIERSGAKTALIVSRGTRSLLEMGRLRVADQFHFYPYVPTPLVPRSLVLEISGRINAEGHVLEEIVEDELKHIASFLQEEKVEACAICLLHSYLNPIHEQVVADKLQNMLPQLHISVSSAIWPEIREYERAILAVMNAYVAPTTSEYLHSLSKELRDRGVRTSLYITKSNGGIMIAETAAEKPVDTLLSGPASGVVGAAYIAKSIGADHCIGFDMGGTSAEVSVIDFGEPLYSTGNTVGDFPVIMPSVDLSSLGAGGGSVAWVDEFGVLKVGPRSVGADPGPACYDKGGKDPTVTDAYLVCGYLNPDNFLGGKIKLNRALAFETIASVGSKLNLNVESAAEAILRIATNNMATTLLPLMTKRGVDVRDYALLAYGGAGPVHATLLAEEVGMHRIFVPLSPGTLCALGSLVNNVKNDYVRTVRKALHEVDFSFIETVFQEMEKDALNWLRNQASQLAETAYVRTADMRYQGQAYEINVTIDDTALKCGYPVWTSKFHERHMQIFNHADPEAKIELINLRLCVIGKFPEIGSPELPKASEPASSVGERGILYRNKKSRASVYLRHTLMPGHSFEGPAIVEQDDTTVLIPPRFFAEVRSNGTIILERKEVN